MLSKKRRHEMFSNLLSDRAASRWLAEDEMGTCLGLTVQGYVWQLPCSLCTFHSVCSFHQKQSGVVVLNEYIFLKMHCQAELFLSMWKKKKLQLTNRVLNLFLMKSSFLRMSFLKVNGANLHGIPPCCWISWMWQVQCVMVEILSPAL